MNRATVMDPGADPEKVIDQEIGDVGEYVTEREKIQDRDVLKALREMDAFDTTRWAVHRVGAIDESHNGWLGDLEPETLTVQNIANRWGPGTYRVAGKYSNGQYAAQRTIRIAGDAVRSTPTPAATAVPVTNSLEEYERRQDARDERRRRERNELLTILVPALAPIGAALVSAIAGRATPPAPFDITGLIAALKPPDPLQMIAALKALQPQVEANQPTALDQALKLIDKFRDMAPSEGGTSWLDVAKEGVRTLGPVVGPMLETAVVRAQSAHTQPVATAGALPSPVATQSPAPIATQENPAMLGMLAMLPWLKTQLDMALQKAARGSDPGLIAERILDDLPDNISPDDLVGFIAREDWWSKMQQFDARVSAYGPWFAQMRRVMLDTLRGPDESIRDGSREVKVTQIDEPAVDRPPNEPPKLA